MSEETTPSTLKELTPSGEKTPISNAIPKKTILKSTPKKTENKTISEAKEQIKKLRPEYKYVGKENLSEIARKSIPKQFIPTTRFASILGIIFLAVAILALTQIPLGQLLSGDINVTIKIGYPWAFLELSLEHPESQPLKLSGLLLDLILYLAISYGIDVIINIVSSAKIIKSKKEIREHAKIFKNVKPTMADKVTKKIFSEVKK